MTNVVEMPRQPRMNEPAPFMDPDIVHMFAQHSALRAEVKAMKAEWKAEKQMLVGLIITLYVGLFLGLVGWI